MFLKLSLSLIIIVDEELESIDCEWSMETNDCSSSCGVGIQTVTMCKTKLENELGYCLQRGGSIGTCFSTGYECNLGPCPDQTSKS